MCIKSFREVGERNLTDLSPPFSRFSRCNFIGVVKFVAHAAPKRYGKFEFSARACKRETSANFVTCSLFFRRCYRRIYLCFPLSFSLIFNLPPFLFFLHSSSLSLTLSLFLFFFSFSFSFWAEKSALVGVLCEIFEWKSSF